MFKFLEPGQRIEPLSPFGQLSKLEFKPGDRFVFITHERISPHAHEWMQGRWAEFFGADAPKLLIMEAGSLGVLRCGDKVPA